MNLFCVSASRLSEEDVALGQALADIATIGLLQERAVRQSGLIAEQLQTALNSRILVEQAKGVLLASAGIDVDQAFKLMRDYSRRNQSTRQDRCPKRRQSGRDRRSAPPPLTPRIGRDGPAEVDPASR